jgi:hypothetical protein
LKTIGFSDVTDLETEALTMDPEENKKRMIALQKKKEAEELYMKTKE